MQADGQLKTGRDVAIAALLGAEEFGFATAPLVVMGCIMMRVCHLDTCPVGVATQNPELRERFNGQAEHVINFFMFIAEEVREIMAQLGFRTLDEMIGRSDLLDMDQAIEHYKAKGLDFSKILYRPEVGPEVAVRRVRGAGPRPARRAGPGAAAEPQIRAILDLPYQVSWCPAVQDLDGEQHDHQRVRRSRAAGGGRAADPERPPHGRHDPGQRGHAQVRPETGCRKTRSASSSTAPPGQSFGAFVPRGITLTLEGDAHDYCGKGLSGGKIVVFPPRQSTFVPEENILIGNVALYGATSGQGILPRQGGRAVLRAQLRRPRRGRRHRRPLLRVHDRRHRRRHRQARAATSARA